MKNSNIKSHRSSKIVKARISRSVGGDVALTIFLIMVGAIMAFPMVFALSFSLKSPHEFFVFPGGSRALHARLPALFFACLLLHGLIEPCVVFFCPDVVGFRVRVQHYVQRKRNPRDRALEVGGAPPRALFPVAGAWH